LEKLLCGPTATGQNVGLPDRPRRLEEAPRGKKKAPVEHPDPCQDNGLFYQGLSVVRISVSWQGLPYKYKITPRRSREKNGSCRSDRISQGSKVLIAVIHLYDKEGRLSTRPAAFAPAVAPLSGFFSGKKKVVGKGGSDPDQANALERGRFSRGEVRGTD
jgi:hypothetical protein